MFAASGGEGVLERVSSTETLKHPEVDTGAAAGGGGPQDPALPQLTFDQQESEGLKREFQKYFDLELEFHDLDSTFDKIKDSLVKLTNETQWVPRNWVYS